LRKRTLIHLWFSLWCILAVFSESRQAPSQDIDAFVGHIKALLEARDLPAFLETMNPELREQKAARFRSMFDDFGMEALKVYPAAVQRRTEGTYHVFLRVLFQNPYAVLMDLWRLEAVRSSTGWRIRRTEYTEDVRMLYKIQLPSDRVVRARSFEIRHADIRISFQNAVCFYDNIPDLETALIVVGDGQLHFSPSHPREKHQLELVYKKPFLEDRLEYVYLRISPSFYESNVTIVPETDAEPVSEAEINKAYSLFTKHYSRSFTVRNSLTNEMLSVLPQGEEAVFEFKGKKVKDVTYVYSPFARDEIYFYQWKEDRILNLYSPPMGEGQKRLFISFGQKYDVTRYEIDLDFKPDSRFFAGKARIEVESKVGRLNSLKFQLNPGLQVLRIADADNRELFFTEDKLRKSLYIYFLQPPVRGQSSTVDIYYRGRIDPAALIADVVDTGQIDQTIRFGNIRLETLLYSRSALWYPSPDDVDYFTARVKIITPPSFQVISNGRLAEHYVLQNLQDVEDVGPLGNVVHVFEVERPVKYLSFVVGRLTKREEEPGPVPLTYYRGSQTTGDSWDIFSGAREILGFYQSLFGEFPYEKLSIVRRVWASAGGHSPASFIVLNDLPEVIARNLRRSRESPVDLSNWKEYFLAHEIAHQWWGQGIGWESYRDQWLSEGMAQFAAVLFLRHKYGERAFARILEKFAKTTDKRSEWGGITMGTRISYFNFEAYQAIVYNKAALVLNMLRDLLGDEAFFSGIRRFYARNRYRAARSAGFYHAFHDVAPMDLTAFFEPWFDSHLLPEVQITHSTQPTSDGYLLQVRVTQVGTKFMFPLWVEWRESGRRVRRKMVVDDRSTSFEFRTAQEPKKIRFNPEKAVPGRFTIQGQPTPFQPTPTRPPKMENIFFCAGFL